jgi:hypothetical protein
MQWVSGCFLLISNIDNDIHLSFHEILTWQVPGDIELVNMSTQKISLLTTTTKNATSNKQSKQHVGTNGEQ